MPLNSRHPILRKEAGSTIGDIWRGDGEIVGYDGEDRRLKCSEVEWECGDCVVRGDWLVWLESWNDELN